MRLLIVSDSHGNSRILDELASIYMGRVDAFVHCGDSELASSNLIWEMMDTVAGNCDFDPGYQEKLVRQDQPYPYLIVHGHRHQVKGTLELLAKEARQEGVHLVFYGHSHVLRFEQEEGVFFVNPGSIQQPRGPLSEKTYCLLEADKEGITIKVFNHKHQELSEYQYEEAW